MGVIIVFGGAIVAYVVLRTDIVALKQLALEKVRNLQQNYYAQIITMDKVKIETISKRSA